MRQSTVPNPISAIRMPWYKKLYWQIIIGLILGLIYGVVAAAMGWGQFVADWVDPFGDIFLNLLFLIAIPLVLASLITGIASLADLKKLSRIGGKTIGIYLATTFVALIIGLVLVNVLQPGKAVPESMRLRLQETYQSETTDRQDQATVARERGPLQPLVDMVPNNVFNSSTSNRNMLQIVFVAFLFGLALMMIPAEKAKPLLDFFASLDAMIIKVVELIMVFAPIGVFALIASTISSIAGDNLAEIAQLLGALGFYCLVVIGGLLIQLFVTYPVLIKFFTPLKLSTYFSGIAPAQLVAFSTSSSAATLPVTMEMAQEKLGVSEEVSSFVLPLGATINMDGTGLYMAVAAVFIAQTLGMELDLVAQATIVLTALLASIGTAAVPSAGIIMLIIILEAIGVPSTGIALIFGVDRILDMCRTLTNVSGDLTVATIVAVSEGQLALVPPNTALMAEGG